MTMTKEEKQSLERQRCEGKVRCAELWSTIVQLEAMLSTYRKQHDHWRRRAESADRRLAEEFKLKRISMGKSGKCQTAATSDVTLNLTKSQIKQIAATLGISLEEE
jgi:hypothetical protein